MHLLFFIATTLSLNFVKSDGLITVLTLILLLPFVFQLKQLINKTLIPLGMILLSLLITMFDGLDLIHIISKTKPFTMTILMLISVTLLSSLINSKNLLNTYGYISSIFQSKKNTDFMLYSSALISPFLNMATPVIYGEMLNNLSNSNSRLAASTVKRGMMISMLIAPTFAPIALVIGSHPSVSWPSTLIYSLPLALITLFFFCFRKKI